MKNDFTNLISIVQRSQDGLISTNDLLHFLKEARRQSIRDEEKNTRFLDRIAAECCDPNA